MAASKDSVFPNLINTMKAGKGQVSEASLKILYDNLFNRAIVRPEPSSSSSIQQEKSKCIFVDIDGTLLHGNQAIVNESLIHQLEAIKRSDPLIQIYLFSSMDMRAFLAQGDRVALFAKLNELNLINGILTTADLNYVGSSGEYTAGSLYKEVYQPLSQLLFKENHEPNVFSLSELKDALEETMKTEQGLVLRSALKECLEEWDDSKPVGDVISKLVNRIDTLCSQNEKFQPDENIDNGSKGLLLQLFLKNNPEIGQATLIDDAQEYLASFMRVCEHHQIPFLIHNAKDYQHLLRFSTSTNHSQFRQLTNYFLDQEYNAFKDLYLAISRQDKPAYDVAVRKLLDLTTYFNSLNRANLPIGLDSPCGEADLANLGQIQENLIVLQDQLKARPTGLDRLRSIVSIQNEIKGKVEVQQQALLAYANQGHPIALYELAHCLSNKALPLLAAQGNKEIPHDLAAAYHFAHAALACLDKLSPETLRSEWKNKISTLLVDITQQARRVGIDLSQTSQPEQTTWLIAGMNALQLRQHLQSRKAILEKAQPASEKDSRPCALLDYDGTLKFGQPNEIHYNDALLDVLWEKGIRDVYILSSFHLSYEIVLDREAGIRHLQNRGFRVHGIISPTDLVWSRKTLALEYVDAVKKGASRELITSEPFNQLLELGDVTPGIAFQDFSQTIKETFAPYEAEALIRCSEDELKKIGDYPPEPRYFLTTEAPYYQGPNDKKPVKIQVLDVTLNTMLDQFPKTIQLTPEKRIQLFQLTGHIPEVRELSEISMEGHDLVSAEGSVARELGFTGKGGLYQLLLRNKPAWVNEFVFVDDADTMVDSVRAAHNTFPGPKPPLYCVHTHVKHREISNNAEIEPFNPVQEVQKDNPRTELSQQYYRAAMAHRSVETDSPELNEQALIAAKQDEQDYLNIYSALIRHIDVLLDENNRVQYSPAILAYVQALKSEIPVYPERTTIEKLQNYRNVYFLAPTIFPTRGVNREHYNKALEMVEGKASTSFFDRLGSGPSRATDPVKFISENLLSANSTQLERLSNLALNGNNALFKSPSLYTAFECLALAFMKANDDTKLRYGEMLLDFVQEHDFDEIAKDRKGTHPAISQQITTWRNNIEIALGYGCPEQYSEMKQYARRIIQIYSVTIPLLTQDKDYKERLTDRLQSIDTSHPQTQPAAIEPVSSSSAPGSSM